MSFCCQLNCIKFIPQLHKRKYMHKLLAKQISPSTIKPGRQSWKCQFYWKCPLLLTSTLISLIRHLFTSVHVAVFIAATLIILWKWFFHKACLVIIWKKKTFAVILEQSQQIEFFFYKFKRKARPVCVTCLACTFLHLRFIQAQAFNRIKFNSTTLQ